jgi:tRNA 2-thiocytidine biosynthesis protein TtcA
VVKKMLQDWDVQFPGRVESIFSSICNASASQLADPASFDFAGLERQRNVSSSAAAPESAGSTASPESLHPIVL